MDHLRSSRYTPVRRSEDEKFQDLPTHHSLSPATSYLGWILATIFAFTTSFLLFRPLLVTGHNDIASAGPFSTGFPTEFNPIKPYIKEKPTMFYGGPRWYNNGTSYRVQNPSQPIYVGPPNDDMDKAWDELLKNRYFTVTEEEAETTFGKPHGVYNHTNGLGYLVGLDVLHTLHCVNEVRKALDKDHYFNKKTKKAYPERDHRDHCLDQIRQQLMCHADLTPIPVIWYSGYGRSFVQSDVVHTCRDWDAIKEFVASR
ncbi:hypothetical protein CFE70_009978 [Pyrenophora teres f. teres 0-1]|uniref:DUF3328 domain containing protein n=2 Tax=Pyrenophora teres f. teres TaxID=97479 RepID=E3SA18_PYRTT|nr:hypothetical protein PTT_19931 [Pyrenophora teres f. teres 0-1]KAE8826811.1 hypothetical protein HRS9139_07983 [Pyrenophora teres f. teres]KAE8832328.1 hypothetical protein PTNB85_06720 [Pyrenophora teres f. teres]KAE8837063.1 hypothetical protein HRS9122_07218 [Pyrenophora teres f. teres]KAE8855990.1 hypothetical protein PTNB29_08829 [Pyrenophora teres f. teres]